MNQVPVTNPTGKNNMLASLVAYMNQYLPGKIPSGIYDGNFVSYKVNLEQYEEAASYPSISVEDIGMPGLGAYAFDSYVGKYVDGNGVTQPFYGKKAQTMVEFNMQADANAVGANIARQAVYQMYDQVDYLLRYTGELDHNNATMLPVIQLMDYDTNPASWTPSTIWCPTEKDSILFPTYIGTDSERPNIKRLSLRARIWWHTQELPATVV